MTSPTQPPRAVCAVLMACAALLMVATGCQGEPQPQEADGAYLLFRSALLQGNKATVYGYLSQDTKKVYEDRYATFQDMSEQIIRFLPQTDQKLARQQTGVVLLKKEGIEDSEGLFTYLFKLDALKTEDTLPGLEIGSGIRFPGGVAYNDDETEAAIVTWANDQYHMVKEDDGIWRVASWRKDAQEKTAWIETNKENLEKTIQDLISEEKEEIDTVIKYLLAQEQKRASRSKAN